MEPTPTSENDDTLVTERNELRQLVSEALAILRDDDDRLSIKDWIRSATVALERR